MKITIPTTEGPEEVEAIDTGVPGIVLIQHYGDWYGVTHKHTGFAFFNRVPNEKLGRLLAKALGGSANWDVRTVDGTMLIYKGLPIELKRWIQDVASSCNSKCGAEHDGERRKYMRMLESKQRPQSRSHRGA